MKGTTSTARFPKIKKNKNKKGNVKDNMTYDNYQLKGTRNQNLS